MKASAAREAVIRKMLKVIAREDVKIIAVIVKKAHILRPPEDNEEIYRQAVTLAVSQAVKRWRKVEIYLDKRYTSKRLRNELEKEIRDRIADFHQQVVLIHQEDSLSRKELQAADFIAWAFFQKYERGDSQFYDLIADRVIVEQVVKRWLW